MSLPEQQLGQRFFQEGGETLLAKSKQQKESMLAQYSEWLARSQAVILVEYTGLRMADLDAIRARMRSVGGEFHVVKNTLAKLALERSGLSAPPDFCENSTAMALAFGDVAETSRAFHEVVKNLPAVKIKGGFLGMKAISAAEIQALVALPPLPVLRGQLLGVLLAPASKLARTLAEPGRRVAAVLKAHSDKAAATA